MLLTRLWINFEELTSIAQERVIELAALHDSLTCPGDQRLLSDLTGEPGEVPWCPIAVAHTETAVIWTLRETFAGTTFAAGEQVVFDRVLYRALVHEALGAGAELLRRYPATLVAARPFQNEVLLRREARWARPAADERG